MNRVEKTPKKIKISHVIIKHGTLLAVCAIILGIFINSLTGGDFGLLGPDNDDFMRLVQIKDYLGGQSWFYTDQYRMGLAGGTDMHWSRIPDIPIILFTYFFTFFMPQEQALVWAFTIWPPLSALILIYGLLIGAKYLGGAKTKIFTLVLLAVYLFPFYRFAPGAIDHHNLQLGFLGLSAAFALDPKLRFWPYFISGCALAIAIAVGVEIYIFAAVICAFVAIQWALIGKVTTAATQGFGLGFALMLILTFFGTVAPTEYGLIYCDALSLVTVTLGTIGGIGLFGLAKIGQITDFENDMRYRLLGLTLLGVICSVVLFFQGLQCLANPLDSLPSEVVDLWLNNISEARPLTHATVNKTSRVPYMICAPIIAVIVLILDIRKSLVQRKNSETTVTSMQNTSGKFLLLVLIIVSLGLTFYQMRFYPFAYVFAIVPLAGWISNVYVKTKLKNPASVVYLATIIAAMPFAWAFPGDIFANFETAEEEKTNDKKVANCTSEDILKSFQVLPKGTILTHSDMTGFILLKTDHRVISGNYHRNTEGITLEIQVAVSNPDHSGQLLIANNIDYFYYCASAAQTKTYIQHDENGLMAKIAKGYIPDYLEVISSPTLEGGDAIIFKVKR